MNDSIRSGLAALSLGQLAGVTTPGGVLTRDGGISMRLHHLFDGPDGKSKLEILEIPSKETAHGPFRYLFDAPTESMYISAGPPGHFIDWHPAGRPQFFIAIQGCFETGLEDGSTNRLMPGEFLLAEDRNPKGHTSRVVSDEWAVQLCCVLKDSGDVYLPSFPD